MIGLAFVEGYCLAIEAAILSAYPSPFTVGATVFVACLFVASLWGRTGP